LRSIRPEVRFLPSAHNKLKNEMKEFQKKCADIVRKIDEKYGIKRDPHLSFAQLTEEVGELANEISKPKLRNKLANKENLKGEFADVFLQIIILADILEIDIEEAVENKIKVLKERGYLEY
jgi:NTP pyrophosphatase (non-canonical NTP hydrolase)